MIVERLGREPEIDSNRSLVVLFKMKKRISRPNGQDYYTSSGMSFNSIECFFKATLVYS